MRVLSDMFNYTDYYRLSIEALQHPRHYAGSRPAIVSGARTYLAAAHLLHDQPVRALNNLEIAVVLDKGNFAAHGLMVEALAQLGDREEALLRSFFMAVNLYPPLASLCGRGPFSRFSFGTGRCCDRRVEKMHSFLCSNL